MITAYLQHGDGAGPFMTESVPAKESRVPATTRAGRRPTFIVLLVGGRWRRVFGNGRGRLFIGRDAETGTRVTLESVS